MAEERLVVSINSMCSSGVILDIGPDRHPEKLELLTPLLEDLPWDMERLQLGKTMEELGNPERIGRATCGHTMTVEWRGKRLAVQSYDGGPGAGAALWEKWRTFDSAARPYYLSRAINSSEDLLRYDEAFDEQQRPDEAKGLKVHLRQAREELPQRGTVVLHLVGGSPELEGLMPQLQRLEEIIDLTGTLEDLTRPWSELYVGGTLEENPGAQSLDEYKDSTWGMWESHFDTYTVEWKGKLLKVRDVTSRNLEGSGDEVSQQWLAFLKAVRPLFRGLPAGARPPSSGSPSSSSGSPN